VTLPSFDLVTLDFDLVAVDALVFKEAGTGYAFRGGLGWMLAKAHCADPKACRSGCLRPSGCPCGRLFSVAPPAGSALPSHLRDAPAPFVIHPPPAPERREPGDSMRMGLTLVGSGTALLDEVRRAVAALGAEGLGPYRRRFEAREAACYRERSDAFRSARPRVPGRLKVGFITATELLQGTRRAGRPEFALLARRARDRALALALCHGGLPAWPGEDPGFAARASEVRLAADATRWVDARRKSTRTGREHELAGFVGEAEYEGPVEEFVPWLALAERLHVGRHASFGNGRVRIS
jgi:hypothetical protein